MITFEIKSTPSLFFFLYFSYTFFQMLSMEAQMESDVGSRPRKKKIRTEEFKPDIFVPIIIQNEEDWNPVPAFICSVIRQKTERSDQDEDAELNTP